MKSIRLEIVMILFIGMMSANNPVFAVDESYQNLSKKLVSLRGSVNDLNSELSMLRENHKQEMRGLLNQKNNIDAEYKQKSIALDTLRQTLKDNRELINTTGSDKSVVSEELLIETGKLKDYIKQSVPFKLSERLQAVEDFEQQLQSGVLAPHKAANIFWSMIEDELKLTGENGIYRQPLVIGGKEYLVDIAKVGMMLLYYRIDDERYGAIKNINGEWKSEDIDSSGQEDMVKELFSSLEKQVRTGYFELPNVY